MAKPDYYWESPEEWSEWSEWLAAGLHARHRWRLPVLLGGMLFARGRLTVTTWLRAAGISVQEIVEAFADRATIEQDFHDVKEVWGAGQQQVRNIWTNVAVYQLNLWMHTLVELWAWNRTHEELCDRSDSPWDDADRRPSHANRRKALRQQIMDTELSNITTAWRLPQKILQLTERLMDLAA